MSEESSFKNDEKLKTLDLEEYVRYLEEKLREYEDEKRKLKLKLKLYKTEIEKLISSPLIEAVVVKVLENNKVLVKSSSGPTLIVDYLPSIKKEELYPGRYVALNQRGSTIVEVLPDREDPYVSSMEVIEKPNVRYSDIGGLDTQIMELREVVELPIKNPELFEEIGIEPPKGVLLYGPPGCGKTLLAKAVARESDAVFISVVGSELVQKFIGEGARIVREIFELARRKAPAIVFIDEIDSIAARRIDIGTSGEREVQRTLMQLLAELDGFKPLDRIKVIAATNRVDILDPAILRPGRLDRLIEVPPPDENGRFEILKIHTRRMKLAEDVDLWEIASLTKGLCGAELKAIVTEAGYFAIRNSRRIVCREDFIKAIEKIMSKKNLRDSNIYNWYNYVDYSKYVTQ
uniref:Proteasome-activating nucleotidase n=1 Tax=Staphylothermus marinus TaxID=2280 RepID=A0A7C4JL38_STAMA